MFNPRYSITNRIVNKLSEIAEIKVIIGRSRLLPVKEAFIKRSALIKMAHTSTSIEGNSLKEYQVEDLVQGKKIAAQDREILEVKNYLSALKKIDRRAVLKNELNVKDILDFHRIVVGGLVERKKTGAFRTKPVYIINVLQGGKEQLVYTLPPAGEVPMLINELLNWLNINLQIHPVIRAGLFHYQFETIHPFSDGNGRTGRLLTLLHLYQSAWDFKKVLVLEEYYNRNRKKYYQALQTGKDYNSRVKADLTNWLEYFIDGFLDEAQKAKEAVLNLSVINDKEITRNILTTDELKIVDFTLSLGRITSTDVADILSVPKRTAQAKLKKLVEIKVLRPRGAGPATFYIIPKI